MKSKVYIVAELSANHNNDYEIARKTILAIKESGADAVKFQTYTADSLSLNIDNEYFGPLKEGLWKGKKPYDLYQEASMPWEWQKSLSEYAISLGLDWLSSPFDFEAVDFLEDLNVPAYKVASMEITDIPLIEYIASKSKPVIMSAGVANEQDIETAINACKKQNNSQITILKCTSQYPAPVEKANLATIPDMRDKFKVKVGLSDHSPDNIIPIVAVSLGAVMVEKHFILDRSLGGPDSSFSLEPSEFALMVKEVRKVEKVLGKVNYELNEKDRLRRRSIFSVKKINKGDIIDSSNVKSLRPGHGLHPGMLKNIIGQRAKIDIPAGTPFRMEFVE